MSISTPQGEFSNIEAYISEKSQDSDTFRCQCKSLDKFMAKIFGKGANGENLVHYSVYNELKRKKQGWEKLLWEIWITEVMN